MRRWTKVKWSEARQVAEAMGLAEEERPGEGLAPEAWYAEIVSAGDLERAASLIGHALPRYESVAWAARQLEAQSHVRKLPARDQQALDRALRWLDEPTDEFRRETFEAAEQASEDSAERMLANAVFLSGGSIAPADLNPVSPLPELSGRFAVSAVLIAAHRSADAPAALKDALASAEAIAVQGLVPSGP
ncbi:MAG TPA: hypothetical protein VF574_11880 [Allosphingosinicella sp.]|jgi:hypothetical protein